MRSDAIGRARRAAGGLLAAALLCGGLTAAGAERAPLPTRRPNLEIMTSAHRGVAARAPENTLPAIAAAIELDYDYVELDVRYTRDRVPVLMHDAWVTRTTGGLGPVRLYDLAHLKLLDAGWLRCPGFIGTRVPTADEALALMAGKIKLYLDQKEPPTPEFIERLEDRGFLPDRLIIVGDGPNTQNFLRLRPDAPVMPGLDPGDDPGPRIDQLLADFPSMAAVNTRCQWLTPEMVDAAHARGLLVFTNVLALPPRVEKKCMRVPLELGADVVQFDNLDLFLKVRDQMREEL